jgi:hypothetical protein
MEFPEVKMKGYAYQGVLAVVSEQEPLWDPI